MNCDGDAELIASKSSSNTIRLNTIKTSVGMISLRAGNDSVVTDNIVLSSTFAHAACESCTMDGNTAINLNSRGAIIGHGGSGVAPSGSTFRNNQLRGSVTLINLSNAGDTVISGNTTSGTNPPLPHSPLTTLDVGVNAP